MQGEHFLRYSQHRQIQKGHNPMKMQIVFHCNPRAHVAKTYHTLDIDEFLKRACKLDD